MKKLKCILCALLVCVLCSCNISLMSFTSQNKEQIKHSYTYFSGEKKYSVTLAENESFTISYLQENGKLNITITNADKEIIYDSDVDENEETVDAKPGKYKIKVTANKASGSYIIKWK